MMNFPSDVPSSAVRRLSLYLRQLEALEADGVATVSSFTLAESLGITDSQVRKDLAYFGQFGRPGVGYEVTSLIHRLREIFGTDRTSQALLVGVGNLGRAVAAYPGFQPRGFELVAIFDSDPGKIGQRIAHLSVHSMADLPRIAGQYGARLGIVAVPAASAQRVADQLVTVGIRGILNFAPSQLKTPPGISVRNIDVAAELEQLNFAASMAAPEMAGPREILIVDDDEANVVFLSEIVEDLGHHFQVARDGEEATVAIRGRRPDLVLLDLMMPRKSGIAVFQDMKADPELRDIPVIIVSGASEVTGVNLKTGEGAYGQSREDDIDYRFGIILYEILKGCEPEGLIEKPIDPTLLSERIRELLS